MPAADMPRSRLEPDKRVARVPSLCTRLGTQRHVETL
jgi:hypothetical protein